MKATALVPAAGHGARVGANRNKVLLPLLGTPLIVWTLRSLEQSPQIENIIVIAQDKDIDEISALVSQHKLRKVSAFAPGGQQRQESVYNGLHHATVLNEIVIIHDAARPLASPELFERVSVAAEEFGAAIAAVPIRDTLTRADDRGVAVETVSRDNLWSVQTPQAFQKKLLLHAHERAHDEGFEGTDDGTLVRRYGGAVRIVPGEPCNIKLTEQTDFDLAEALLRRLSVC